MKVELDYTKKLVLYPVKTVKTKDDKEFYVRNMQIKSTYDDILIVMKGVKKEDIELIVNKDSA